MAKTPSKKLFNIIHSLSSQEKRYLKVIARNKGELNNKYLRLFELIEATSAFDEDFYKSELYPELSPKSKKYSELKSYLYEFVLRCLRDFDESSSIDYRIKNGLLNVRSLFARSKFKYALIEINKNIKLSQKYEKFKWTLELLEWKKKIAYTQSDISFFDKNLSAIQKKEQEVMAQLENYKAFDYAFYQLYLFLRKNPTRSESNLNAFVKSEILSAPQYALSFKALVYYHRIWSIYYFALGAFYKFTDENNVLIEKIEGNPSFLKEDISHYISVLSNNSVAGFLTKDYSKVKDSLSKLSNIKPLSLDDEIRINRQYYSSKFKLSILSGDFQEGVKATLTLRSLVSSEHWPVFNNASFLFQYFYLHFGIGDYERALDYLNEWTDLPKHSERQDLQMVARILLLVIHYEMDNMLLMSSLIRSSKRYLGLKKKSLLLERLILPVFSEVMKEPSKTGRKEIFEKLLSELEKVPVKSNPMSNVFDFEVWLRSQITKEKFADLIRQKYLDSTR